MNEILKYDPFPFQGIGIFRARKRHKGRCLIADDPGLGKTLQSLLASVPLMRKRSIVVICPGGVKYQWQKQVSDILGLNSWVLEGQKPPSRLPLHIPPVIILNWEILNFWKWKIREIRPNIIIADEIHWAKNPSAKRTKALRYVCKDVLYVYGLSGTPFENNPIELFVILNLLRPDLFPSRREFGFEYTNPKHTPWGIKYEGARNVRQLNKLLKRELMVRRRFDQVIKDLPPLRRDVIPVKIDMKKYSKMEKDIRRWLAKFKPNKVYKSKKLKFIAKLNYLLQMVAMMKLPVIFEWIDNFLATTDQKICVFGYHREFLENLHEHYKDQSVLIYGGLSKKKRRMAIESFLKNKDTRICFGGITAIGTGTDGLQEVCHVMLIVELIWKGLGLIQLERRLHRIGQKNPVTVSYMVVPNTVESMKMKSITKKQEYFNNVIDNRVDMNEFESFDETIDLFRKGKIK